MLPRINRLTYNEFQKIKSPLSKFWTGVLSLFTKEQENHHPRFVIITPKQLDKRSAKRHTIKRIIIEAIRENMANIKNNKSVMIRVNKKINKKDKQLINDEIKLLFRKAGLV